MQNLKALMIIAIGAALPLMYGCTNVQIKKEVPRETIPLLNSYSLEIFDDSKQCPSYLVFRNGKEQIYKETATSGDLIEVVFAPVPHVLEELVPSPGASNQIDHDKTAAVPLTNDKASEVVIELTKPNNTFEYLVFKLDKKIEKIATIPTSYSQATIESLGKKDYYVIKTNDWFNAWGSRAIAPEVILTWDGNKFVLDTKAMRKSAPTEAQLANLRSTIHEGFKRMDRNINSPIDLAPSELASSIIDLYYTGQGKIARHFYDSCWPSNQSGKNTYWLFIMNQIKKSNYWPDIKSMNQ